MLNLVKLSKRFSLLPEKLGIVRFKSILNWRSLIGQENQLKALFQLR